MPISHISDTARWVAAYRARESERPDALFHDPYARRLAGLQGEEIARVFRNTRRIQSAVVVRTRVLDEMITEIVRREGIDLVLNLAAGLDTRAWRVELPADLRWIEVDLPILIAFKRGELSGETPHCRVEWVTLDLADLDARRAFLSSATRDARRGLVVTEGLLMYLSAEDVAALAEDLSATPTLVSWVFDQISPRVQAMLTRSDGRLLAAGGSALRFAPPEGIRFFERYGWRERQYRDTIEEGLRLGRPMPGTALWRLLSTLSTWVRDEGRRMGGMVELARA